MRMKLKSAGSRMLAFPCAVGLAVGGLAGAGGVLHAQAVPPPMPAYQPLGGAQLDSLLAPIALYPDPLIAEILPAATQPQEIMLADGYLIGGGDPNQAGQQPWDPAVQAVAHYPTVMEWLAQNLNWTTEVGQAFVNQQQDVMDSIQRLRRTAYNLGNLQTTPQESIIDDGSDIEIVPADPNEVYLPVYESDQVYYDQAGSSPWITFSPGYALGGWLSYDFDWYHHGVVRWDRDHPRPANWWRQPAHERDGRNFGTWHPGNRPEAAPVTRGDRGWTRNPVVRPQSTVNVTVIGQAGRQAPRTAERPLAPARPEPAANNRPESNGAFIGIQNTRDTRTFSERGQQSHQEATHTAPAPQPHAPVSHPAPSGGGGGGSHATGSSNRH